MPTYEYRCKDCGEHLEVVQSFTDDPLTTCEVCGADRNTGACPGHERTDPRWDGLDAVLAMLED